MGSVIGLPMLKLVSIQHKINKREIAKCEKPLGNSGVELLDKEPCHLDLGSGEVYNETRRSGSRDVSDGRLIGRWSSQ